MKIAIGPACGRALAISAAALLVLAVPLHAQTKTGARALAVQPSPPVTQFIVSFRDEVAAGERVAMTVPRVDGLSKSAGAQLLYRRPMAALAHVFRLRDPLPRAAAESLAVRLRQASGIAAVEIDEYMFPLLEPNDPSYADATVERMWSLKAPTALRAGGINLPTAWGLTRGQGAVVAVIDTGIFNHEDLEANILRGHDFISADADGGFVVANDGDGRDADPSDPGDWITADDKTKPLFASCSERNSSWHGTRVAGTVAAVGNNGTGIPGVAYEAKVLAVRALGKCFGYASDITDAIRWASGAAPASGTWASLGVPSNPDPAKVINLSLGATSSSCSATRQSAIDAARAAGAVVVAATGNDGGLTIGSPANCQGVIAVTSHTIEGDNSDFANVGPGTTISAPGGGNCSVGALNCLPHGTSGATGTLYRLVFSTIGDGAQGPGPNRRVFAGYTGTSAATPHVSGVVALLFAQMPTLKPDTVKNILTASARAFPANTYCVQFGDGRCGAGMLDAKRALDRLADLTPTVTATAPAAIVRNGSAVALTGSATPKPAGLPTLTLSWQQLSGPTVTLANATTLQPSFTAPTPGATLGFRLSASDADGLVGSAVVSLRANGLPVMNTPVPVTVTTGSAASFRVGATDPEGDTVTFSASGLPTGATFNGTTGEFSWANATPAGSYAIAITPNDGFEAGPPVTVTVTVNNPRGGGGSMDLLLLVSLGLWGAKRMLPAPCRSVLDEERA